MEKIKSKLINFFFILPCLCLIAYGIYGIFINPSYITFKPGLQHLDRWYLWIYDLDVYIISIIFGVTWTYAEITRKGEDIAEKFIVENENIVPVRHKRNLSIIIDMFFVYLLYSLFVMLSLLDILNIDLQYFYTTFPLAIIILIFFLYYVLQEIIFQSTIGKMFFKIKLVAIKQPQPSPLIFKQLLFRFILRFHWLNFFAIFPKRPVFYHDLFSQTIPVIKAIDKAKKTLKNYPKPTSSIHNIFKQSKKKRKINRDDAVKQLKESKEMLDSGILTQKEYDIIAKRLKPIIIDN